MSDVKRYEVTIERQYIVYAPSPEDAGAKALTHAGFRRQPGQENAMIPAKVIMVTELPTLRDEKQSPVIDLPPRR